MSISMHDASAGVFVKMLNNLSAILDKAAAHAKARGFDESVLLQSRLFPDMLPLTKQVQIACDAAKFGVSRLAGVEAPSFADDETTIEQLRARIAATVDFIQGVPADALAGTEDKEITIPLRGGAQALKMKGLDYLLHFAQPNLYFHVATAYGLLRHNGVDLGKRDFLGAV